MLHRDNFLFFLFFLIHKTKNNSGLNLNLALSYGSRQEIIHATKKIIQKVLIDEIDIDDIDETLFSSFLYTKDLIDPDLLIRTGGEFRISNFLLWQIAYTEIYFSKVFWPDFNRERLEEAITDFNSRERRYGKLKE